MARLLSAPRPPAPSPTGPRPRLRTRRQKRAEVSRGATNPSSKSTQERGRARGRHPSSLRLGQGHHATRRDNWLHRPRQRHGWLPRYRTNAGGKSSNLALGLCQKATSGSSIGLEKPSCTHSQALEIAVEGPVSRLFAHESCNYLLLGSPKKGEPLLHRHGRAYPARHGTAPVQVGRACDNPPSARDFKQEASMHATSSMSLQRTDTGPGLNRTDYRVTDNMQSSIASRCHMPRKDHEQH